MSSFGVVASGDSTDKKKAAGTRIAAIGIEPRQQIVRLGCDPLTTRC
jgi:hypothetical protein